MVNRTIILYPNKDDSFSHSAKSGNNGYLQIDDATPDDDSTYIYQELSTRSESLESTFSCSASTSKIYLKSVSVLVRSGMICTNRSDYLESVTASITPSVSINGGSYVSGNRVSYSSAPTNITYADSNSNNLSISGLNTIYTNADALNVKLRLSTTGNFTERVKTPTVNCRITQANVTITYENVYDCESSYVNGTGIQSTSVSAAEVREDETATFSCVLQEGYEFVGWYSDESGTELVSTLQTYTATITENTKIYAKGRLLYRMTAVADEHSSVSVTRELAPLDAQVTFSADIESQYIFMGWYSNPERTTLVSTQNPYTINVVGDTALYCGTVREHLMHVKVNGVWTLVNDIYKKVNGSWVKQNVYVGLFDEDKKYKKNEA